MQAILVLSSGYDHLSAESWVFSSIFFSCLAILIANGIFNIIWLERYYPDNLPSRNFMRTSLIFYILSIVVISLFVFMWSVLLFNLFGEDAPENRHWRTTANFIFLFVTAAGGVYILICRLALLRLIRHNQRQQFNSFLENSA